MPKWTELRRFLDRHGKYIRSGGNHLIYLYKGQRIRVSNGSGEIGHAQWKDILKHQ